MEGWLRTQAGVQISNLINKYTVPSIVSTNLYFSLDAATYTSGSTWSDSSGNGRNGTLVNSPTFTSGALPYFTLNGSNQYVNMGTHNLQQPWSLETWVLFNSATRDDAIWGQGTTSTNNGLHIIHLGAGARKMTFAFFSNDNDYGTNFNLVANTWYHFMFVYDRNNANDKRFYVNGTLITPTASVENTYSGTGQLNIGATYSSATSPMQGRLGIARMYTSPLTQSEITQNFNALRGRYGL